MLLGILSDTHLDTPGIGGLPDWVVSAFSGVDLILHAGDIETDGVLLELEGIAPVRAVRGNCDFDLPGLPTIRTVPIPDYGVILLAHKLEDAMRSGLLGGSVRVRGIVHGHTHRAEFRNTLSPWVLNPGSPLKPRGGAASVALLRIEGEHLEAAFRFRPGSADE
ncbi:MAG TPA: YfcE family phosphodiesterase [Candidatus Ozemobacteraceae bacterium]|nr:YfcE family phosphodiesterase [Candidatus Ozemobacteraceae bacterium]